MFVREWKCALCFDALAALEELELRAIGQSELSIEELHSGVCVGDTLIAPDQPQNVPGQSSEPQSKKHTRTLFTTLLCAALLALPAPGGDALRAVHLTGFPRVPSDGGGDARTPNRHACATD
jgi:hypothetical protein